MDSSARARNDGHVLAMGRPFGVVGLLAAGLLAASASTAVAATAPVVVSAPTVTGATLVGGSQSATDGSWSGDPVPALSRRWLRCDDHGNGCVPIGESAATRQLVHADGGRSLRVEVTATNTAGVTVATSLPTTVIGELPVNATAPSLGGTALVGQTLSTDDGIWWGYPFPIVTRAWQRCDAAGACAAIPYGSDQAYRVRHTDVGWRLRVSVTVASILGSGVAASTFTAVVPPAAPLAIAAPIVGGAPVVGVAIGGVPATWEGAATVRRSWERCDDNGACTAIPRASGLSYRVAAADLGRTLRLTETATNTIGVSRIASPLTTRVEAPQARSLALGLRTLVAVPGSRMAIRVRCALDQPGIRTCAATIAHDGVVVARGAVSTASRTAASLTIRVPVTPALRRLAARQAGSSVTLTAQATQDDRAGSWPATRTLLLAPSMSVVEAAKPLFHGGSARLRATADLRRLRSAVADASSLICTGHTAWSGNQDAGHPGRAPAGPRGVRVPGRWTQADDGAAQLGLVPTRRVERDRQGARAQRAG